MPNTLTRNKHFRFKMRATKELPARDFAVEFTRSHLELRKVGCNNGTNRISWPHLIGHMLIHGTQERDVDLSDWRGFLVEMKTTGMPSSVYEVKFGRRGVAIRQHDQNVDREFIVWSWRLVIGFAIVGGGR